MSVDAFMYIMRGWFTKYLVIKTTLENYIKLASISAKPSSHDDASGALNDTINQQSIQSKD